MSTSVDPDEIARFTALSSKWWDERGPMAPLHKLNPLRVGWIKGQISGRFGRDIADPKALAGLTILDIGCGGGIMAEPLTRMGATVTGIDPSVEVIAAAKHHANLMGLDIDYRAVTAEQLAEAGEQFDIVTILEVVEHVNDVPEFVQLAASLVKPGGLLIASTINRTLKAYLLAIIGAEYVLRWLPRGTHTYDKLVTPDELIAAFRGAGLSPAADTGVIYIPILDEFRLSRDMDVNYMATATRA